jgi:PIN domain nuclease of toxin-antitoxin system
MASYLIDTHIFLWAIDNPKKLTAAELSILEDATVDVAVSVASFWELSIKFAKGALQLRSGKMRITGDYFARHAAIAGFSVLNIDAPAAEFIRSLPAIHNDPFDRLLIAQAILHTRIVITRGIVFGNYPGVQVYPQPPRP